MFGRVGRVRVGRSLLVYFLLFITVGSGFYFILVWFFFRGVGLVVSLI